MWFKNLRIRRNLHLQPPLLPPHRSYRLPHQSTEGCSASAEEKDACSFNAILELFLADSACFLRIDRSDGLTDRDILLRNLQLPSSSEAGSSAGTV